MKDCLLEYCASAKRRLFREGSRWALLMSVLMVMYSSANGQVTAEFKTPGAGTWTVPAGVTEVVVEAWGGGGCGASSPSAGGKAGGGGGAYARSKLAVAPGDVISYEVGAGSATTDPGGDSWFLDAVSVLAKGGVSGAGNFGGAGGNSADCKGNEAVFSGGSGANRGTSGSYRDGGGGGSAAGSAATGTNTTSYVVAAAAAGGGNGGNSKSASVDTYVDAAGQPGGAPGGGGGGGYSATFVSVAGGTGGDGMIRITYTPASPPEIELVSLAPASLCPNVAHSLSVTFTPSGFSGAQTFTVELSNASGSFASPVVIGTGGSSPLTAAIPGGALTAGGNYKIRVVRYHANGNIFSDDLGISLLTPPSITVGANPSVCIGTATASLSYSSATGNPDQYSIAWGTSAINIGFASVTNATLPSGSINIPIPAAAAANTTYTGQLTVRNSTGGCVSNTYNISVEIKERPVINSVMDLSLCFGSTTQLALPYTSTGAAGNFSIKWKTKAANAGFTDIVKDALWGSPLGVPIPQNAAPDVYTGTMTIENGATGCVSDGYDFNITINPLPTITLGASPSVCAGVTSASLTYTGVTNNPNQYSIAWEVPAGLAGFSTVTDASFPSGGAPIAVPVPANVAPGTYDGRLYIKNTSTKCSGTGYQTFRVEVIARPSIILGANPTVCVGASSASISYSSATGNPGQYSITWDAAAVSAGFGNVTNVALPSGSINIAVPGTATQNTYTGKLTVRNTTTGCVSQEYNIGVTVINQPSLSIGAAPSVCAGVTGASLPFTATGNPDQYSISWGTAATAEGFANVVNAALSGSSVSLVIPAGAAPGTYTGSMVVRNSLAGCSGTSQSISVTVYSRPVVTLSATSPVSLCAGDDTLLTANTGPGYSYEWKDDFGAVGSGISYTASITGIYYVVVTDGNNCRDSSDFLSVTVYQPPVVSIVPGDTAFCEGTSVRFEAQSSETGLEYLWKNGGVPLPVTTDFMNVSTSGNYYVVAERSAVPGCMDSSNVATVTVHPLPSVSISRDGEKLYTDDWYVSYQWLINGQPVPGTSGASSVFEPDSDGDYSVQITDSNGCVSISPVEKIRLGISGVLTSTIRVYPNPVSDVLHIESADFVAVSLYSMEGRILGQYDGAGFQIDVAHFPEGIYIAMISDKDGLLISREMFVKRSR